MTDSISERFKNASGAWLLKALFFEVTTDFDREKCLYSFKPEDHVYKGKTYPSIRRLYLEMADETEYYFAEKYFGGWPHWKKLCACRWFEDYMSEIREELAAKQMADARARIKEVAADKKDRGSLQANRLLLDEAKKSKNPVGRPSKESIRRKAEELFQDQSEFQEDLDRITNSMGSFQ